MEIKWILLIALLVDLVVIFKTPLSSSFFIYEVILAAVLAISIAVVKYF